MTQEEINLDLSLLERLFCLLIHQKESEAADAIVVQPNLDLGEIGPEKLQLVLDIVEGLWNAGKREAGLILIEKVVNSPNTSKLPTPAFFELLSFIANLQYENGNIDFAIHYLLKAIKILEKAYGSESPETIEPLEKLIKVLKNKEDIDKAKRKLAKARESSSLRRRELDASMGMSKSNKSNTTNVVAFRDIFYFTHRASSGIWDAGRFYGTARGSLEFGIAHVIAPLNPQLAPTSRDRVLQIEFRTKASDYAHLKDISKLSNENSFYKELQTTVDRSERRELLFFIHGFNVSFCGAVERAAKLSVDLDLDGASVVYSWPSQATLISYFVDRNNILRDYLEDLADTIASIVSRISPTSFTLVAHSMGNEFLLGALELLHLRFGADIHISEVVFASPDIDRQNFITRVEPLIDMASRMTLYTSRQDRALLLSEYLQAYERAGNSKSPIVIHGLDTIDTSLASKGWIGHTDFAGTALDDFRAVTWMSMPPSKRIFLAPLEVENGYIWRMLSPNNREVDSVAFSQALVLARRFGKKAVSYAKDVLQKTQSTDPIKITLGRRIVEILEGMPLERET